MHGAFVEGNAVFKEFLGQCSLRLCQAGFQLIQDKPLNLLGTNEATKGWHLIEHSGKPIWTLSFRMKGIESC
ncbi:hypothetical protein D3C77_631120 [compost metagenome]